MSDERQSSAVHPIRLGGQWDFEPLPHAETPQESLPGVRRLQHLSDYAGAVGSEFKGRIRLVRWFGRPTGLVPKQRVDLAGSGLPTDMTISLNGQVLQPSLAACLPERSDRPAWLRFDVSALLQDRNRLAIEFDASAIPSARGANEDVRLEIFAGDQSDQSDQS